MTPTCILYTYDPADELTRAELRSVASHKHSYNHGKTLL